MSKIYQELEQIFKFRILSNDDIAPYMKRMSALGKIDAVKSEAIITLILKRLGELEDQQESPTSYTKVDAMSAQEGTTYFLLNTGYECPDCDFVAKSNLGLLSHSRKHQK